VLLIAEYLNTTSFLYFPLAYLLFVKVHGDDEIGTLRLTMYGSDADILVMSPAEYQLACLMKEPTPVDLGNFVLSPMPGTLISFAVKVSSVQAKSHLLTTETYVYIMIGLTSQLAGGRRRRDGARVVCSRGDENAKCHSFA
jgi:hypothetical protein